MNYLRDWFHRYFSDPQAVFLAVFLVTLLAIVLFMGEMLLPVLAALVIAYLLEGGVALAERKGAPRLRMMLLVFLVFLVFATALLLVVVPLVWVQITEMVAELPQFLARSHEVLNKLPEAYPSFISQEQVHELLNYINAKLADMGRQVLGKTLGLIPGIITLFVYSILVPLLVFFFLKDKNLIIRWFSGMMPKERPLADRIWAEVNQQLGNYVRGKFIEILIVGVTTYVVFALLGLKFALLLGVLVGLSVLIPFIGAAVVTLPVALVAYLQWGFDDMFWWLLLAYGIIQMLDGNVLVPLIFSEVVNLHPVAIIVAVLVFGGLWGFWGVFFAIPLATLVNAVLCAWPRSEPGPKQQQA